MRIAVCVGGTSTSLALLDENNQILQESSLATHCGGALMDACKAAKDRSAFTLDNWSEFVNHRKTFLDELGRKISEIAIWAHKNSSASLQGVGVSSPGALHPVTGRILGKIGALNLPAWGEFNIREELNFRTGLDIFAINDAKAMALGALARIREDVVVLTSEDEQLFEQEADSFIELDPGTGLGGAYVVEKQIWFGPDLENPDPDVGEIWKLLADPEQPTINLEELSSGRAALNRVKQALYKQESQEAKLLFDRASGRIQEMLKKASPELSLIIQTQLIETGRHLGLGILHLMTHEKERLKAPDIRTFMIGGGMVSRSTKEAQLVRARLHKGIRSVIGDKTVQILFSTLGSKAGVYGSAALVG